MAIFYAHENAIPEDDLAEAKDILDNLYIVNAHLENNGLMRLIVNNEHGFGEIMFYPSWTRSKN